MNAKAVEGIIRKRVLDALTRYRDDEEPHDVPSPSGIASCFRKQVAARRGIPHTNPGKPAWIKKAEQGRLVEPFWQEVFERAQFSLIDLTASERQKVGDGPMTGIGDRIMADHTGEIPIAMLLELKDLGMFTYFSFLEQGLQKGLPDYWYQVQSYLEEYDLPFAVVLAGQADASACTWWFRTRKTCTRKKKPHDHTCVDKYHGDEQIWPDPFVVELVPRAPADFDWANQRAKDVVYYADDATIPLRQVPRDYDPTLPKWNNRTSPCTWCPIKDACLEAGE